MSGSRSLCRLKANLRHDLCNIVEHSPVYGTFIQIPPFLLIVGMLLSKKQNKRLEEKQVDELTVAIINELQRLKNDPDALKQFRIIVQKVANEEWQEPSSLTRHRGCL